MRVELGRRLPAISKLTAIAQSRHNAVFPAQEADSIGIGGKMGSQYGAICASCRHKFTVSEGGGFRFHLLHCDRCGRDKSIGFEELGEAHLKYLKGLPGPYAMATAAHDKEVQSTYEGEPLSRKAYESYVEELASLCTCGGHYRFEAAPRCPQCRSSQFEVDPEAFDIMVD